MSEIADFLRARYAERRALAVAAAEDSGMTWSPGDECLSSSVHETDSGAPVVIGPWDYLDWDVRRHIAINDPAAVIADCDAKLSLVDLLTLTESWSGYHTGRAALYALAQPFAGHADHKGEEWGS
ncbi:DUF6221 family protein [Streptomyces venezuelae]|uniref:DUF6221 family protein n=1 Tax=Streptomyces venezuelae TaxID=54571 RepID=UPI00341A2ECE